MGAYLARLIENHELVGIFYAESSEELACLIDECCNTDFVEVLELGEGGVYWASSINFTVPFKASEGSSDEQNLPPNAVFTERWFEKFLGHSNGKSWSKITF